MSHDDVKVVLLGREFCGKTSLAERFLNRRYRGGTDGGKYQNTIGAAYGARKVSVAGLGEVLLGLWDTAGSEKYESMSRFYYRSAKAAIVCYDVTNAESWDKMVHWVAELKRSEKACKIYVCANKADEDELAVVDFRRALAFAEQEGAAAVETSSKTGMHVEELFQKVAFDYLSDPANGKVAGGGVTKLGGGRQGRRRANCCV